MRKRYGEKFGSRTGARNWTDGKVRPIESGSKQNIMLDPIHGADAIAWEMTI